MSRQSRMVDTLTQATELLTRADNALAGVLAVIAAEHTAVHLQAQSFDGVRVSGFTTEVDDDGHPIPVRSDPVGRAVADGLDSQDSALLVIETRVREVARAVEALVVALQPHQATGHRMTAPRSELAREAAEAALEQARVDRENAPCCRSCSRIDVESVVHKRREVEGDVMGLCRWCYDFVRSTGALPTREQLSDHHAGGKVRHRVR